MNRKNLRKFLYGISAMLLAAFLIGVVADYAAYRPAEDSAPFYAFVLARAVEFVLPSLILFIVARIKKNP